MAIRLDALTDNMLREQAWHVPVRVATTGNITISTGLNNGDTLDGVTLATGDRVLVKDQSTGSQNGIYIVGATPARAYDLLAGVQARGAFVFVIAGTVNGQTLWHNTNASLPTIDTTALTWEQFSSGGSTFSVPFDHGSMGSTETVDLADGDWHRGTLTANCAITVQGFTVDEGVVLLLEVTQDGTGGWDITWDADVDFGGADDQPSQTAGTTTTFMLWSSAGDSTVYGAKVGGTAVPSFATPAIVLGTVAAAGAASTVIRSDSTIVAFDATVPVTQAFGDAAATGSASVAARRDHKHGMPSSSGSGIGEILISDTPSTPLVFGDLIQNEAQDDLVYADP